MTLLSKSSFVLLIAVVLGVPRLHAQPAVLVEAESGTRGSEIATTGSAPVYISVTTNNAGSSPTSAARVARYQVAFPAAGTYRLFARVRVGAGGGSDDSFFIGNGFGAKNPVTASDWKAINNFSGTGYVNGADVVPNSNGGTAGTGVWKWIDASALGAITYTVNDGNLVQTLDIGGREDGLDIDKLVFGISTQVFTVEDLNGVTDGTPPVTTVRTLEAEASQYGGELVATPGTPSYLTVSTDNPNVPGSGARVMRFPVTFSATGIYRLFIRLRIGSGGANDDSLFLGNGFGAKDPTLASDWRMVNNFAYNGFTTASDVVPASNAGTAGTGVWKWFDLSALAGVTFTVSANALSQTVDIGGRENGLDIDKIVFAPTGYTYTVANLDAGVLGTPVSYATALTVALKEPQQVIDGFGASSAWTAQNISDALADQFFSQTSGIGLSLLRVRIDPSGVTWETGTAQKAVARGAQVWATPWSPPAAWKSNGDVNNGGTLLPEFQDDWAARLAAFVVNMRNAGITLRALSSQNEPNYTATWESCTWTPVTLSAFVRDHLGPALVARNVTTRVMAPEVINMGTLGPFGDALMGDATTRSYVSQVASHSYGSPVVAYPVAAANNIALWQTEFTDPGADSDPSIDSGLRVGNAIHDFLTIAGGNAWHYWWLLPNASDNPASTGALVENGVLAKRGWALGNWARFVRPGHRRVQTYGSNEAIRATAFVSPTTRRLTLVVVNSDSNDLTVPVAINGGGVPSLTPWETSATRSLTGLTAILPASDGSFSLSLPARSVTTFVSEALNRPPADLALDAATVLENRLAGTVVGHLSAIDPDAGETFTYALVSGDGDEENAAFSIVGNELRTAVPLDFEAGSARSVRIRATDSLGANYERFLAIAVIDDTAEFADWVASLPESERGANEDSNGDGFVNLLAYAFGSTANGSVPFADRPSLEAAGAGSVAFTFTLPPVAPADVRYQIERSVNLGPWTVLATKEGNGAWNGSVSPTTGAATGGRAQIRLVAPIEGPSAFYRLRCILSSTQTP